MSFRSAASGIICGQAEPLKFIRLEQMGQRETALREKLSVTALVFVPGSDEFVVNPQHCTANKK